MRPFEHLNALSIEDAAAALKNPGSVALAGGGDLIGALKDDIFPEYPKTVVNLKKIAGLSGVSAEGGVLKIGAMTTLAETAKDMLVNQYAPAIAAAAGAASSPTLRETTTIGGNVCQLPRCWYFRKLNNRFYCKRKGGDRCFAASGDNRYHSVFGAENGCFASCQSDTAPVLRALDAVFVTTEREIPASEFFGAGTLASTVLKRGEILTEIRVPITDLALNCRYKRFAFRKSIDFPVLSVVTARDAEKNYRIVLGGVSPVPRAAAQAQEYLRGRDITPEVAAEAGNLAVRGARPLKDNEYKLQLIKTLVKRELLQHL